MFNFFKKKITNENIKDFSKASQSFNQWLRLIRVILYVELQAELKQAVDAEYVKVLAAQIVNFLTGDAINDSYQKADDSNKLKIDQIRDKILPLS